MQRLMCAARHVDVAVIESQPRIVTQNGGNNLVDDGIRQQVCPSERGSTTQTELKVSLAGMFLVWCQFTAGFDC